MISDLKEGRERPMITKTTKTTTRRSRRRLIDETTKIVLRRGVPDRVVHEFLCSSHHHRNVSFCDL